MVPFDFSYSISENNWKCGFFLTLFPYFWRKGAHTIANLSSWAELFCITTKNGRYPRVFTLSSWCENALNTIDKRNIHDIEGPAETKICQKVWKWNQGTKYFIVLFLLLFINYSLVQVTIRIITCSWIISTLWWTRVSSFRILLRWKCPVSLLCVRFKICQQRLKRPPWLEENADVQLSAVCYTYI